MDLYYRQEIKVGVLVIVGLAILFGGLIWLTGRGAPGRARAQVEVRFAGVSGLTEGDPVMVSGVQVGRVSRVELERVGSVLVTLDVDQRLRARTDATAQVKALDFLGSKFVAYDPGSAETFLADGAIDGLEQTDLASNAGELAEGAAKLLSDETVGQVRATMAAAERALDVMARLGRGPLISDAEATLATVQRAAARLDSTLANPAIDESVNQLDELTTNVNEMAAGLALATTSLGQILAKMDSTGGTMGRLVNDTTIHQDLHDVLTQMRLLLEDIRLRPGRYAPGAVKIF